jgi:hypothetical protein
MVALTTAAKVALRVPVAVPAPKFVVDVLSVPSAVFCAPLTFKAAAVMPEATMVLEPPEETKFTVSTPAIVTVPAVTSLRVKVALSAVPATAAVV